MKYDWATAIPDLAYQAPSRCRLDSHIKSEPDNVRRFSCWQMINTTRRVARHYVLWLQLEQGSVNKRGHSFPLGLNPLSGGG
jgi:hypothetical protein